MVFRGRRRLAWFSGGFLVLFLAAAAISGCGSGRQSETQQLDEYFKNNPKAKKETLAKFAGHVSIDGQSPAKDKKLFVILTDPDHPVRPSKQPPAHFAACDAEGNFEFTTYLKGDGVPVGKYVVTFVELHTPKAGPGPHPMGMPSFATKYVGPDDLKNLYSDPEKNKADSTYLVDVKSAKSDYDFSLAVAGKDGGPPSDYAVTTLTSGS
jgi:hypothetical protein